MGDGPEQVLARPRTIPAHSWSVMVLAVPSAETQLSGWTPSSGVESGGHAPPEFDGVAADGAGDDGPFFLGVAGDVDAAAEGDGSVVKLLAKVDLPVPRLPATSMFGLVRTPFW